MKYKSLYTVFMQCLSFEQSDIAHVYANLFKLKDERQMQQDLQYMYDINKGRDTIDESSWFEAWHKTIRQVGFFENCSQTETVALLTDEELKELRTLLHTYHFDTREQKTDGANGTTFNDQYSRYLELHSKRKRQDIQKSIDGVLDMTLWNLIHADKDDILCNIFLSTFKTFDQYLHFERT